MASDLTPTQHQAIDDAVERVLTLVRALDASAADDGASDRYPSGRTEQAYCAVEDALRAELARPREEPLCFMCHGTGKHSVAAAHLPGQPAPAQMIVDCRQCTPAPKQGDAKDARPDPFHSDSGECDSVHIDWPKEKRVGRREDMSPDGTLIVGLDSDNDVYVEVSGDRHGQWQSACVEFCNGGGGGGQSSRTRAALINLMTAIEADNAELPHKAFPGAAILASKATAAGEGKS